MDKESSKEAWLGCCRILRESIDCSVYIPSAAMYKVMMEAVRDHEEEIVKQTAFNVLMKNVKFHQPGPATDHSRHCINMYLYLFSSSIPHIGVSKDKLGFNW